VNKLEVITVRCSRRWLFVWNCSYRWNVSTERRRNNTEKKRYWL